MTTAARAPLVAPSEVDVPEGWTRARLPEIANINMGQSPPGSTYNEEAKGMPFFQGKADFGDRYPTVRVWCTEPKKIAKQGDVLISVRAPVGPTNLAGSECAIGRGLAALTPLGGIPSEFLLFALRLQEPELALSGTGSTFTAISKDDLQEIEIDVPPLAEQKRIVAKVEELLARVNAARKRLNRVPTILKRFRQSVLAAACSGRLTADWREAHPSATHEVQELVERLRNERNARGEDWLEVSFEQREQADLPDSWEYVALGNLGQWGSGGTPSKSKDEYWVGGSFPWVSPKDMKAEKILDSQDHITDKALEQMKIVPENSILFVVRGLILARSFPVAVASRRLTINQDIRTVTPYQGVVPAYLLRALQYESRPILFAVRDSTHGTRRLESHTLRAWPIPLPSPDEQEEVVRRVEALFKLAEAIEKRVAGAGARGEKLTQAILAKAFRGELVPTEAELARRENRPYEPASTLLARIQGQLEAKRHEPPAAKRRNRKP